MAAIVKYVLYRYSDSCAVLPLDIFFTGSLGCVRFIFYIYLFIFYIIYILYYKR